jgi:uncharacterized protein YbbK (DUF523 family)/ribosomal protein S18 acetylase RimI-like enzyme
MEIVSACLVGVACRYNAHCRTDPALALRFAKGDLLPICPELEGGLGLPRPPSEIRGGAGAEVLEGKARVVDSEGGDVTEAFISGARATLAAARAAGASEAFLAANSPSCGAGFVYDGSFSGRLIPGDGVAAALLRQNGIRITCVERARLAASPGASPASSPRSEGEALIRMARIEDCAELARLAGELGYPCDEGAVRLRIGSYLEGGGKTVIVAESGGGLVGWTSVEVVEHFYLERFAEISGFVVDARMRGRGIGASIMAEAEAWTIARGVELLRLKTNVTREGAHRFYEALGFERVKEQYTYAKRLEAKSEGRA